MNILYIDYVKNEIGGGHFVLARLANYFSQQKGKDVIPYVYLNNYQRFFERFLSNVTNKIEYTIPKEILALDRYTKVFQLVAGILNILKYCYLFGLEIKKYSKNNSINIIHANGITAFMLCSIPVKHCGVKLIYHLHDALIGQEEGGNLSRYLQGILIFFMRFFADRIIANSQFVRSTVIKRNANIASKVVTIHNGVNLMDHLPMIHKRNVSFSEIRGGKRKVNILSFGRLHKSKGFDLGIISASILQKKYKTPFEYKIIGDGPYQECLGKLTKELNLEDYVHFLGFQDKVSDFISWADIVLVPSKWQEPFGLAVIESMLGGSVVIATNVGAIPEIIEDGETGLLVSLKNAPQEMADCIVELIKEPDRYDKISCNAIKRVREYFNMDRMAKEIVSVYKSVAQV